MELETILSKDIRAADLRTAYDAACKRLLSQKIILAWIMKECLTEYQACTVEDIAEKYIEGTPQISEVPVTPDDTLIHGASTEDTTIHEGTIVYDIRFYATVPSSQDSIRLIINLEAQNDFYPGYPLMKRALYYCSRMISSQYGVEFTTSHYEKIKKVYSIWICMNPPGNRNNTITRYRVTEENIIGHVRENPENYDLLSVIMLCLGNAEETTDTNALKLLDVLLSTQNSPEQKQQILQDDFNIPMTKPLESEVSLMCNLSKGVADKALAEGIALGRKEGRQEGIQEGRQEGRQEGIQEGRQEGRQEGIQEGLVLGSTNAKLDSIRSLTKNMHVSIQEAMDMLDIPQAERSEYENALKN